MENQIEAFILGYAFCLVVIVLFNAMMKSK